MKHSWIKNQILYYSLSTIVSLWKQGKSNLGDEQLEDLNSLDFLVNNMVDGFSPLQLIDKLRPFEHLSISEQTAFKEAIQSAYLEKTNLIELQSRLKKTASELGGAIHDFSKIWCLPVTQNSTLLESAWLKIRGLAEQLESELEELPRGILLP